MKSQEDQKHIERSAEILSCLAREKQRSLKTPAEAAHELEMDRETLAAAGRDFELKRRRFLEWFSGKKKSR